MAKDGKEFDIDGEPQNYGAFSILNRPIQTIADVDRLIAPQSAAIIASQTIAMQTLVARLDSWLKKYRRDFLIALEPPASEDEIAAIEKKLGSQLPDYFKVLLRWHNGQANDFYDSFHPITGEMMMGTQRICYTLNYMVELHLSGDIPKFSWNAQLVPFMTDGGGNESCLDIKTGIIYYRNHEICELEKIHASLPLWLTEIVEILEGNAEKGWTFDESDD